MPSEEKRTLVKTMIDISKMTWYTLHCQVYICGREEGCSRYHHVSIVLSTPFTCQLSRLVYEGIYVCSTYNTAAKNVQDFTVTFCVYLHRVMHKKSMLCLCCKSLVVIFHYYPYYLFILTTQTVASD